MQLLNQRPGLKGVLFTSAKDSFIAGADITEFLGIFAGPEDELTAQVSAAVTIIDQVADFAVPTVAAINGLALGGGFELCLAVDYRALADDAKVGLPEVKLGIHPGFGGSVRLPRLIGCDNAIEWIASGNEQKAAEALRVGAVDAVVPQAQLAWCGAWVIGSEPSQAISISANGALEKDEPVLLNAIEMMMTFTTSIGYVAAQAGPNMPAPLASVKTIEKSANSPRAQALAIETKGFAKLAKTPQAEALIPVFF